MSVDLEEWRTVHQKFEVGWWGDVCKTSFGEEYKQIAYAKRMGFTFFHDGKSPFNIDAQHKSIIDIGGGPCSLLLKMHNLKSGVVVDPANYPAWVYERYASVGIDVMQIPAEELPVGLTAFDEALIYNCLQHTIDPEKIVANAKRVARIVRIFEWIECGTSEGHPHELTEAGLNEWLGGIGKVGQVSENTAVGRAYWGIFRGDSYEEV